jgi:hypothetical protein
MPDYCWKLRQIARYAVAAGFRVDFENASMQAILE